MELHTLQVRELTDGFSFKIRVQPRSSRTAVVGLYEDGLKVCLTSPPVDGEANRACIEFFALLLKIPKSRIAITAGHKSRTKTMKVTGVDVKTFFDRVAQIEM